MTAFKPGNPGGPGRKLGARVRLSGAFLHALADDFAEHGVEAIRIMRIEEPAAYVKAICSLMPRELDITTNVLTEVPDDELDNAIHYVRERLIAKQQLVVDVGSREEPEADREPACLLHALPKAS
jgi:hypothetical protein